MYDIYSNNHDDSWRYTLGKNGERRLLVIGLNPSTATREKSDTTVAKVEGAAIRNGFDGFVMLNLYPVRSTKYNELPADVDDGAFSENINRIEALVASETQPIIWAAWGESIFARSYFVTAARVLLARLQKHSPTWQHFGPPTRSGHPRHPSRLQYGWDFSPLDVTNYSQTLAT